MRRTIYFIVLFAVLLVSMSAYTERTYDAAEGFSAPDLTLSREDTTVSLSDIKGKYVLVSFWSSANAQSRMAAGVYDDWSKQLDGERFCLLSVNLDRSERLYREIVRRDGLNAENQYHLAGKDAESIFSRFHLANGYRAFLVNPQGKIVATNPSETTLSEFMR